MSILENNTIDLQKILDAVNALPNAGSGGTAPAEPVIQELTVTENGTYIAPDGVDGYSPVTVNVPEPDLVLQEKSVTPAKSAQSVTPDSGYDGLSKVNVGAIPGEYIIPSGSMTITQNGTHDVGEKASVTVAVETGSGGGGTGTVETCTVTLQTLNGISPVEGFYPVFDGNDISYCYWYEGNAVVLENVVVGKPIYLWVDAYMSDDISITSDSGLTVYYNDGASTLLFECTQSGKCNIVIEGVSV